MDSLYLVPQVSKLLQLVSSLCWKPQGRAHMSLVSSIVGRRCFRYSILTHNCQRIYIIADVAVIVGRRHPGEAHSLKQHEETDKIRRGRARTYTCGSSILRQRVVMRRQEVC
jgi:hypothetical protein